MATGWEVIIKVVPAMSTRVTCPITRQIGKIVSKEDYLSSFEGPSPCLSNTLILAGECGTSGGKIYLKHRVCCRYGCDREIGGGTRGGVEGCQGPFAAVREVVRHDIHRVGLRMGSQHLQRFDNSEEATKSMWAKACIGMVLRIHYFDCSKMVTNPFQLFCASSY